MGRIRRKKAKKLRTSKWRAIRTKMKTPVVQYTMTRKSDQKRKGKQMMLVVALARSRRYKWCS